jgi:hypothetical protein
METLNGGPRNVPAGAEHFLLILFVIGLEEAEGT